MIRWLLRQNQGIRRLRIRRFLEATAATREVQERVLLNTIRNSAQTVYGRKNGFSSIRSVDEFRKRVPINSYEDLRPYVDREVAGEKNVLLNPADQLVMFAKTSGTTGQGKLIPVTRSFCRNYQIAFRLWSYGCLEHHPQILGGSILPIVTAANETTTHSGIPIGSISGLIARQQRLLARRIYAVPQAISAIQQGDARYYTLMRIALTKNVSLLSTVNPSTLLLLARLADERKEALIRDVHDGALAVRESIPRELFRLIQRRIVRNPRRARELEKLANRRGRLLPMDYWPKLALITCWKGGPLKLFLNCLPEFYGDVPVRDLGLLASEGRFSIPFSDQGAGGILNINGAFFEFIPDSDELTGGTRTLLAHELQEGRNYRLILTSCNGLFRYDMHDVVHVDGFEGTAPVISFVNKGQHIASIAGEKISEYQLVTAVQEGVGSAMPERFIVSPAWDAVPYYTISVEEFDARRVTHWATTLDAIDHRLRELNTEYASKRDSRRIGPMRLTLVSNGTLASMNSVETNTGQHKQVYLKTEIDYHQRYPRIDQIHAASAASQGQVR